MLSLRTAGGEQKDTAKRKGAERAANDSFHTSRVTQFTFEVNQIHGSDGDLHYPTDCDKMCANNRSLLFREQL